MSNLRYAIVIPAGGGKTTLCKDPFFLDVDALYHLREAQSTYDRLNSELQRRAELRAAIPASVGKDLRGRIARYPGPAPCLLVHTVAVARQSGLELLGVYLPNGDLHAAAISQRHDTGRWFARSNVAVVTEECATDRRVRPHRYGTWGELAEMVGKVREGRGSMPARGEGMGARVDEKHDEEFLLGMLTSAVGCEFEEGEQDQEL